MTDTQKPYRRPWRKRFFSLVVDAPWNLIALIARPLYGFRVEGKENTPKRGPYIVAVTEMGLLGVITTGYISLKLVLHELERHGMRALIFLQEELYVFSYFKQAMSPKAETQFRPLTPQSAGPLALHLLDGVRFLRDGSIVVLNPSGEATWDGRPVACRDSLAWVALHTAAPILPALATAGAYDAWPRWRRLPYRRGSFRIAIGKPFRLCETAMEEVGPADLATGTARIQGEYNRTVYGPGGIEGWQGPVLLDGRPAEKPAELQPLRPAVPVSKPDVPASRRGVVQLLWQCPVCHTSEALVHRRPLLKPEAVDCQACGTRWEFRHVPGHDFRMKVVEGSPGLVGLDVPLSLWYDEMKRGFKPVPIPVSGAGLLPGEEVYLEKSGVALVPYRPNALFDGYTGREPPAAQSRATRGVADWASVGEGRLLLTSHRLLWQGPQGELDFMWTRVTSVALWLANILGISYGTAKYRFNLGDELSLKWVFHAGELAKQAANISGQLLSVAYY